MQINWGRSAFCKQIKQEKSVNKMVAKILSREYRVFSLFNRKKTST